MPEPEATQVKQDLAFVLRITSLSELKKKNKKDIQSSTLELCLSQDEEFDTFKAQVLEKISTALQPPQVNYEDYNISYTIKRVQTTRSNLNNLEDYDFMRKRAIAAPKSEVTIFVDQIKSWRARVSFTISICLLSSFFL